MKISEKIYLDKDGLSEHGPITVVAFGDSVTHGAVSIGEIDYETVYWNRLKQKINNVRAYVPVNVINAGIGGVSATTSLKRMDSQVLAHNPDLIIVCFGLNDINGPLEQYIKSMEEIFDKSLKSGAEVIFMTPNMLNTTVADDTPSMHYEYAVKTAEIQNSGIMDLFMESAVHLAETMGVKVCDCYKKWKKLSETQDTTYLLANRINHPTKEMHELFAQSLFDVIFEGTELVSKSEDSTMYEKQDK